MCSFDFSSKIMGSKTIKGKIVAEILKGQTCPVMMSQTLAQKDAICTMITRLTIKHKNDTAPMALGVANESTGDFFMSISFQQRGFHRDEPTVGSSLCPLTRRCFKSLLPTLTGVSKGGSQLGQ